MIIKKIILYICIIIGLIIFIYANYFYLKYIFHLEILQKNTSDKTQNEYYYAQLYKTIDKTNRKRVFFTYKIEARKNITVGFTKANLKNKKYEQDFILNHGTIVLKSGESKEMSGWFISSNKIPTVNLTIESNIFYRIISQYDIDWNPDEKINLKIDL